MRDWLKPAVLVVSLAVILAVILYLFGEAAPTVSGTNADKPVTTTADAPNERSDSVRVNQFAEEPLSAEAEADIQQYRKYHEIGWRMTKEIEAAEAKLHREHPLINIAFQWAREAYREVDAKYPDKEDFYMELLGNEERRETLRKLQDSLSRPVLFFESLNAADPIGDTTLGAITLSVLADTDQFFDGYLKLFADAMESAGVPANQVAEVRASTTSEEVRLLAQRYGPQIMRKYNSELSAMFPDQKMQMMLAEFQRVSVLDTITKLYSRVWDQEIRELREKQEKECGPMNDLWDKYPPNSAGRSAMAAVAQEQAAIVSEERSKTSQEQGNAPKPNGQSK